MIACAVPEGSLLAGFGAPGDYRDCFCRVVAGAVDLGTLIERFYLSAAFRPERLVLGLLGRTASGDQARALARGEADRFGVWEVVEQRDLSRSSSGCEAHPKAEPVAQTRSEILLHSKGTGTASWLAVEPLTVSSTKPSSSSGCEAQPKAEPIGRTRMYFGSWVGTVGQTGWRFMLRPHQLYSRMLLGAV